MNVTKNKKISYFRKQKISEGDFLTVTRNDSGYFGPNTSKTDEESFTCFVYEIKDMEFYFNNEKFHLVKMYDIESNMKYVFDIKGDCILLGKEYQIEPEDIKSNNWRIGTIKKKDI